MVIPDLKIGALRAVADRLDQLGLPYAFVGGAIVNLLLDEPAFAPVRPTDDVDVILQLVVAERYSIFEEKVRRLGFANDISENAPLCRWVLGALKVDLMPVDAARLGLNTTWFAEALASATVKEFAHTKLNLISPAAFLATKLTAFADRGNGDYYGSHDLEDCLTVIDGRANIVGEVQSAPEALRGFLATTLHRLLQVPAFNESLSGHLPNDRASQMRLPGLRQKLQGLAQLKARLGND